MNRHMLLHFDFAHSHVCDFLSDQILTAVQTFLSTVMLLTWLQMHCSWLPLSLGGATYYLPACSHMSYFMASGIYALQTKLTVLMSALVAKPIVVL